MYSYGWVLLVMISLGLSLVVFVWALMSGQFSDQARARYFPLRDQAITAPTIDPTRVPLEVYVLMAIAAAGVSVMLAPVVMTIWHRLQG